MGGQVFDTHLIHLCPGVNEKVWHSVLTKFFFLKETLTKAELSICRAMCGKPPKMETCFGLVDLSLKHEEAGGVSLLSVEILWYFRCKGGE